MTVLLWGRLKIKYWSFELEISSVQTNVIGSLIGCWRRVVQLFKGCRTHNCWYYQSQKLQFQFSTRVLSPSVIYLRTAPVFKGKLSALNDSRRFGDSCKNKVAATSRLFRDENSHPRRQKRVRRLCPLNAHQRSQVWTSGRQTDSRRSFPAYLWAQPLLYQLNTICRPFE